MKAMVATNSGRSKTGVHHLFSLCQKGAGNNVPIQTRYRRILKFSSAGSFFFLIFNRQSETLFSKFKKSQTANADGKCMRHFFELFISIDKQYSGKNRASASAVSVFFLYMCHIYLLNGRVMGHIMHHIIWPINRPF